MPFRPVTARARARLAAQQQLAPRTRLPHMSWRRVALRALSRRAASHSQAARANGSSAVNSSFQDIPCQLTSGITGWRPHPIRDKTTKKGKQK